MDAWMELPERGDERADEARPQAPIWAEPRGLFFFRLGTLLGNGLRTQVDILALAESGAIVRVGQRLEEAEGLVLELNSHHHFAARVEWSSGELVGLDSRIAVMSAKRSRRGTAPTPTGRRASRSAPKFSCAWATPASPHGRPTSRRAGSG